MNIRNVQIITDGIETQDGAGVKLSRIIGSANLNMVDPFLLLDEFGTDNPDDYIAGFPPHPHRGFETITYMLNGKWQHKDSAGNEGILRDGSVQWMTAGRGIIHSEMPIQTDGLARGFQLWLNLPKSKKMIEPHYQDIDRDTIPVHQSNNSSIKIISGEFSGKVGPGKSHTPVLILDITLNKNSDVEIPVPDGWNAFGFLYDGKAHVSESILNKNQIAVFDQNGKIHIKAEDNGASIYFAAGLPLNEPVARGGPFVMNTRGEILQAFYDFESGKFEKEEMEN